MKYERLYITSSSARSNMKNFVDWITKIGDGTFGSNNGKEADIEIPTDLLILKSSSSLTSIVDFTYPNLTHIAY